jgi:hypothetical protein
MVYPYKLRHRDLEKLMHTYKVILEISVGDDLIGNNPQIPMTKSHRNALIREQLWLRVSDALHLYGLDPHAIKSVVKVQTKKEGSK